MCLPQKQSPTDIGFHFCILFVIHSCRYIDIHILFHIPRFAHVAYDSTIPCEKKGLRKENIKILKCPIK